MDIIYTGFLFLLCLPLTFPITLELERSSKLNVHVPHPAAQDQFHVVNFTLMGSSDMHKMGFYYTKVKIGSPPKDYKLIIDTSSAFTWISCKPCKGCPTHNRFGMPLSYYSPSESSSASQISCSSEFCPTTLKTCPANISSACTYSITTEDYSGYSGYLVEDVFRFATSGPETPFSTSAIFGCSDNRTGRWAANISDGVLGLGHAHYSIVWQLASRYLVPRVFSHCLRRDNGGVLVLGEILHSGIVYSPFVLSGHDYSLNLESMAVSGKFVHTGQEPFVVETLINTGATYTVLPAQAYDSFIELLTAVVSHSAKPMIHEQGLCFLVSRRDKIEKLFPNVSFNFQGSASLIARPRQYLMWQSHVNHVTTWCIGFQRGSGKFILGDLVLTDRIVLYDLVNGQVGWVDHNCSQPVHVNTTLWNGSNLVANRFLKSVLACWLSIGITLSFI